AGALACAGARETVRADRAPLRGEGAGHGLRLVGRVDRGDRAVLFEQEVEEAVEGVCGLPGSKDYVHRLPFEHLVLLREVAVDEHAAPVAAYRRVVVVPAGEPGLD